MRPIGAAVALGQTRHGFVVVGHRMQGHAPARMGVVGVVGVIGPTRLNYARVVPMVDFTAQSLGKLIG